MVTDLSVVNVSYARGVASPDYIIPDKHLIVAAGLLLLAHNAQHSTSIM